MSQHTAWVISFRAKGNDAASKPTIPNVQTDCNRSEQQQDILVPSALVSVYSLHILPSESLTVEQSFLGGLTKRMRKRSAAFSILYSLCEFWERENLENSILFFFFLT